MKKIMFLFCLMPMFLFSYSKNIFFVIDNSMTLECKDVDRLKKLSNKMVQVDYTMSGKKKIHEFSKKNLNRKFGIIANNRVIFLDMLLSSTLADDEITANSIEFYAEDGNIDDFIKTFEHCKVIVE